MVRRPSVGRPQYLNISETAWPINAKFLMECRWVGGTNVCLQHLGHMTNMAAMPVYGKNPSKIFFSRTRRPNSTKLGILHRGLQLTIGYTNDDPGLTWTYLTARSNFVIWVFPQEKVKTVEFSETIAASDLKICRSRHISVFMKVCEIKMFSGINGPIFLRLGI